MINQEPVSRGRGVALPVLRGGPAVLLTLGLITGAATVAAFGESYKGLHAWAAEHGYHGFWAWVWPLQIDAFIAAGELALFLGALYPWLAKVRTLAWTVSVTGLAVSIAFNGGHVGSTASALTQVTAALPPIAAIGGLMVALAVVKQIAHTQSSGEAGTASLTGPEPGTLRMPWMPETPAARAAFTFGMAIDLTDAVMAVTAAVEKVTEAIPSPAVLEPVRGLFLDPIQFAPAIASGQTRAYAVAPATRGNADSVTLEVPEPAPGAEGQDVSVSPDTATDRALDEVRLAGLETPTDRIRAAIDALGVKATPADIEAWLTERAVTDARRENIRSTLRRARSTVALFTGETPSTPVV